MAGIGIIAGSGIQELGCEDIVSIQKVETPYGDPSDLYRVCNISGTELIFLPRHGIPHHIPPHKINYRANLWGFSSLGVKEIISINAVGGINEALRPGDIVIPDQIIDMTQGRTNTFFDRDEVVHIDFTEPFCDSLRELLCCAGEKARIPLIRSGTYVCTNGPRLETKAEIRYFSKIGADIVGMTLMPEASLARELEICFVSISVITNYAAGIAKNKLTTTEVIETMRASIEKIRMLLREFIIIKGEGKKGRCLCQEALKEARM